MNKTTKKHASPQNAQIAVNKRAFHDYAIEDRFEAGLVLQGWEVKSIREGRVQLAEGYVLLKDGAAWLFGVHLTPLKTASTHIVPEPLRTRKLLLHQRELDKLYGSVERKGYTVVPLSIYWKNNRVKVEIALAKGKQQFDKRAAEKDKDWQREKERVFKKG